MAGRGLAVVCLAVACQGKEELPAGLPVTVEESGVIVCSTAGERSTMGPYERRKSAVPLPSDPWTWHGGIIAADLDGDGYTDLLSALELGIEAYQGQATGGIVPRGHADFDGIDLTFASGGSAADFDGDGDLDVYITRVGGPPAPASADGYNRLLRNDGNWVFVDVTEDVGGVSACGEDFRDGTEQCFRSMASSWGDYDRDGDLDLYVGNYGFVDETNGTTQNDMQPAERDFLYRNEGNGTFTDVSDLVPLEFHEGYTYAGGFHDLDGDGALDLYAVNDFGNLWPNRVMWGDGEGGFSFTGGPAGSDGSGLDASQTGMGLGIADFNNDGWLDLAIAEWRKNTLFVSFPAAGAWIESADASDFRVNNQRQQAVGWGTLAGDLDNDGWVDIINQYGHLETENVDQWPNPLQQPDGVYRNLGGEDIRFEDVGEAWGAADRGSSRGAVLADLNHDGWLDIAKRFLDDDDAVYLSRCGEEGWLTVSLEQPGTLNTDAIGARVYVTSQGRTQMQPIVAGGVGYASSPPSVAHFGLGHLLPIEELRVVWPDGQESTINGLDSRQRITVVREP